VYLTRAALEARVGGTAVYLQLTDDDHNAVIDTDVEALLLAGVDRLGDAYLIRGGYTTPLTNAVAISLIVPRLLDIANYKAKSRGGRLASAEDVRAYELALTWFEAVASGDLLLLDSVPIKSTLILDSEEQRMTRERLSGL